mgnify:CR=1 FL=1
MAYEMQLDNMLLNTYSSKCIEIRCGLYDVPSPVHARQMNECKHASIRMLIEIFPKTNHRKLVNKKEKEMGLEDMHHIHAHLLQNLPSRRRVRMSTLS